MSLKQLRNNEMLCR